MASNSDVPSVLDMLSMTQKAIWIAARSDLCFLIAFRSARDVPVEIQRGYVDRQIGRLGRHLMFVPPAVDRSKVRDERYHTVPYPRTALNTAEIR